MSYVRFIAGAMEPANQKENAMTIRIVPSNGSRIAVYTPYNADFVKQARNAGGKWNNSAWVFPAEQSEAVRAILRDVYGEDDAPVPTVRLRVLDFNSSVDTGGNKEVVIAGRQIARIFDRDSGARLGPDIVVLKGEFNSGGSRNPPCISAKSDTVFDILRCPEPKARALATSHAKFFRIVADDGTDFADLPVAPAAKEPSIYDMSDEEFAKFIGDGLVPSEPSPCEVIHFSPAAPLPVFAQIKADMLARVYPRDLVLKQTPDGWMFFAPGSTDHQIAKGAALALRAGPDMATDADRDVAFNRFQAQRAA